jgi:hypothetical protein
MIITNPAGVLPNLYDYLYTDSKKTLIETTSILRGFNFVFLFFQNVFTFMFAIMEVDEHDIVSTRGSINIMIICFQSIAILIFIVVAIFSNGFENCGMCGD